MEEPKRNLKSFAKSKLKKSFESGLVAVRNTLSPYVYDEKMTKMTIKKIEDKSVGISLLLGVSATVFMAATDIYPKNEALSNMNDFFRTLNRTVMSSSGVISGIGAGAFLSAQAERVVTGKKWHFNKNKPIKEDSKASLIGLIDAIDIYLYKNNPELYEKSEAIIAEKKDKILKNDALKSKKQEEKENNKNIFKKGQGR